MNEDASASTATMAPAPTVSPVETESHTIKRRALSGVAILAARQFYLQVLSVIAMIVLARVVSPSDFGLFGIATAFVTIFAFFSDVGLVASLIQQPERPTLLELRTAFTFQQILVGSVVVLGFFVSPLAPQIWQASPEITWLIRVLLLSLFLSSFQTIPKLLLERDLRYGPLAALEVTYFTVYYGLVIVLALLGNGAWSFIVATLLASLSSATLAWVLNPWRLGFRWDGPVIRRLVHFGSPFQLSSGASLLKDNLIPIVGGIAFNATAVGYLNWALSITAVPTRLAHILGRVTFPLYARLQDRPDLLKQAIERSIFFLFAAAMPVTVVIATLIPQIVRFVFTNTWQPAIPAVYFISLNMLGGYVTTPLIPVLNALGLSWRALRIMACWTATCWIAAFPAISLYGFIGIPIAYAAAICVVVPLTLIEIKRVADVNIWQSIRPSVLAILPVALGSVILGPVLVTNLVTLVAMIGCCALLYLVLLYFLIDAELLAQGRQLLRVVRS